VPCEEEEEEEKRTAAATTANGVGAGVFRIRSLLIAIPPMFVLSKLSARESSSKRYGILCIYWIHRHSTTPPVANLQWLHVPACI
jgi:hypothetical protein